MSPLELAAVAAVNRARAAVFEALVACYAADADGEPVVVPLFDCVASLELVSRVIEGRE